MIAFAGSCQLSIRTHKRHTFQARQLVAVEAGGVRQDEEGKRGLSGHLPARLAMDAQHSGRERIRQHEPPAGEGGREGSWQTVQR